MDKIKKGDSVTVIAGKDKGKTGNVVAVKRSDEGNRVVVEGVNIVTKHRKAKRQDEKSEIIKVEAPIDASNVMVNCPTCNRPVRVKFGEVEGKKVRICVKCGTVIADNNAPKPKKEKETRKRRRRTEKTEGEEKTETKRTSRGRRTQVASEDVEG